MITEIFKYIESHQPVATLLTGVLAIFAVILSQMWLDRRQRRDHEHEKNLKSREINLKKKEELIECINEQVKDITKVEDLFDSWCEDFQENYSASEMSQLLRDIDNRVNKIHILIQLYFGEYLKYIEKITGQAQGFLELCADHSMAARYGAYEFSQLDQIEIVEKCNEYAVAYMQLSSHLIDESLMKKYPLSEREN